MESKTAPNRVIRKGKEDLFFSFRQLSSYSAILKSYQYFSYKNQKLLGGIPELVSLQTGFKILHEKKSRCQKQFNWWNFSSSLQECVCITVLQNLSKFDTCSLFCLKRKLKFPKSWTVPRKIHVLFYLKWPEWNEALNFVTFNKS